MNNIVEVCEMIRLEYQKRYYEWYQKFEETNNETIRGHLLETSYVLIEVFGLTSKQVNEVERNHGFTNADLEVK